MIVGELTFIVCVCTREAKKPDPMFLNCNESGKELIYLRKFFLEDIHYEQTRVEITKNIQCNFNKADKIYCLFRKHRSPRIQSWFVPASMTLACVTCAFIVLVCVNEFSETHTNDSNSHGLRFVLV